MSNKEVKSYFAVYGIPNKNGFSRSCIERFKSLERKNIFANLKYAGEYGKINLGRGQKSFYKFKEVFEGDEYLWEKFSRLGKYNNSDNFNLEGFVIRAEIVNEDLFEGSIRNSFESIRKDKKIECCWYDFEDPFKQEKRTSLK